MRAMCGHVCLIVCLHAVPSHQPGDAGVFMWRALSDGWAGGFPPLRPLPSTGHDARHLSADARCAKHAAGGTVPAAYDRPEQRLAVVRPAPHRGAPHLQTHRCRLGRPPESEPQNSAHKSRSSEGDRGCALDDIGVSTAAGVGGRVIGWVISLGIAARWMSGEWAGKHSADT